jgi:hypothetical protein
MARISHVCIYVSTTVFAVDKYANIQIRTMTRENSVTTRKHISNTGKISNTKSILAMNSCVDRV